LSLFSSNGGIVIETGALVKGNPLGALGFWSALYLSRLLAQVFQLFNL
jgi:hypothetical protein